MITTNNAQPGTRLLIIDPVTRRFRDAALQALPELVAPGDVIVVNDSATFPARLWALLPDGQRVEVRLIDPPLTRSSRAVLFGAGSFLERTEDRGSPPLVEVGAVLSFGNVSARVSAVSKLSPRLLWLRWLSPLPAIWDALYQLGKPVQYSYEPSALPLYDVQTLFASRPWSAEMPSAARPLSANLLLSLRARGAQLLSLTHAAGLSATGDAALDRALPLPERYEVPLATAQAVEQAARDGRRVLAVGTTVVRALESAVAQHGSVRAGPGIARLVLGPNTALQRVSGILSGAHAPEESHYQLLQACVDADTLAQASAYSQQQGYRLHEHGDAWLLWPTRRAESIPPNLPKSCGASNSVARLSLLDSATNSRPGDTLRRSVDDRRDTSRTNAWRIPVRARSALFPFLLLVVPLLGVGFSVAQSQSARGARTRSDSSRSWLCWESSGKGARQRRIDRPRSLAYFTKHLADFDREIAWRVANDKARDWSAIRSDVKFVGRFAGQSVLDVFFLLPTEQRPFGKMILVGKPGRFRPLVWILDDSDIHLELSEIKAVQGVSILSTRCRVGSRGNEYVEDYFVLKPRSPVPFNLRPEFETVISAEEKTLLPAGCSVTKSGDFDLGRLEYLTSVWKASDGNCCPSCGRLQITFNLKEGHAIKNQAHYDPKAK